MIRLRNESIFDEASLSDSAIMIQDYWQTKQKTEESLTAMEKENYQEELSPKKERTAVRMKRYFDEATPGDVLATTDFVKFAGHSLESLFRIRLFLNKCTKQNLAFRLHGDVYVKLDPERPESTQQPQLDLFARAYARTCYRHAYPSGLEALYILGLNEMPETCNYFSLGSLSPCEYLGRIITFEATTDTGIVACAPITQNICQAFNELGWSDIPQKTITQIAKQLTKGDYEAFKGDLEYAPSHIKSVGKLILSKSSFSS